MLAFAIVFLVNFDAVEFFGHKSFRLGICQVLGLGYFIPTFKGLLTLIVFFANLKCSQIIKFLGKLDIGGVLHLPSTL